MLVDHGSDGREEMGSGQSVHPDPAPSGVIAAHTPDSDSSEFKPRYDRYLYAAISVVLATILRLLLARFFGYHHPYVTFYIAVLLSAWYGGLGPGLMATVLGVLSGAFVIQPLGVQLNLTGESSFVGLEFYFIVGVTACILFDAQRRAQLASAQHARVASERLAQYEQEAAMRKQAEQAASRAEAQFRIIVKHAPVGIARLSLDGCFTEVNPEFCRITGYAREEALYLTFEDLIHPDDLKETLVGYARLQAGHITSFRQQKRYVRKDHALIWADVTASMVRDHEGKPLYALAVIHDETARHRTDEELREAQKLESIGLLAGGIAHDFNNLLTGILGNASFAMDEAPSDSSLRKSLEGIMEASERAAHLTLQLLAYAGKRSLMTCWSELSGLTRQAAELAQTTAPASVKFRLDLQPGLPLLLADPSQIQQLVTNLIVNGIEAIGDDPGEVHVRTGAMHVTPDDSGLEPALGAIFPGQYVFVAVEDTGSGMDAATIQKMFDPFFTTKFTGRGLGLAAVSGIVRAQGGAVLVDSRRGQGTLIEVLFPVDRNEHPSEVRAPFGKAA